MALIILEMTTILYEGCLENVEEFWDAYNSLIYSMESGNIDKKLVSADLWKKLKSSRPCKRLRHEVKLPYLITKGTTTFTASLVIVTKDCYVEYTQNELLRLIGRKQPQVKMTLENIQNVPKVENIQQGWLQRRFYDLIDGVLTIYGF